ncbi:hypothetical protein RB594_007159 [Gaeumannomyces avenae]
MSPTQNLEGISPARFCEDIRYQWETQPLLEHAEDAAPTASPHKVLVLLPTEEQLTQSFLAGDEDSETRDWAQYNPAFSSMPVLFKHAQSLGASEQGIFKIRIPPSLTNRPEGDLRLPVALRGKKHPCMSYTRQAVGPGDFVRLLPKAVKGGAFERPSAVEAPKPMDVLRAWERLSSLGDRSALHRTRYMVGVDIMNDGVQDGRERASMPELSLIHPLNDNFLREFKAIRGIMTPYKYEGKPLAPFAWHVEDVDLIALNHLLLGTKVWFAIPPDSREAAERVFQAQELVPQARVDQVQFMRHDSIVGGHRALRAAGAAVIPVIQAAGEIVVTLPKTYHSGFSVTYTVAESVNYAQVPVDLENYQFCPAGYSCGSCKIQKGDFERVEPWSGAGTPKAFETDSTRSRLSTPETVSDVEGYQYQIISPIKTEFQPAGSPKLAPNPVPKPTGDGSESPLSMLEATPDVEMQVEVKQIAVAADGTLRLPVFEEEIEVIVEASLDIAPMLTPSPVPDPTGEGSEPPSHPLDVAPGIEVEAQVEQEEVAMVQTPDSLFSDYDDTEVQAEEVPAAVGEIPGLSVYDKSVAEDQFEETAAPVSKTPLPVYGEGDTPRSPIYDEDGIEVHVARPPVAADKTPHSPIYDEIERIVDEISIGASSAGGVQRSDFEATQPEEWTELRWDPYNPDADLDAFHDYDSQESSPDEEIDYLSEELSAEEAPICIPVAEPGSERKRNRSADEGMYPCKPPRKVRRVEGDNRIPRLPDRRCSV